MTKNYTIKNADSAHIATITTPDGHVFSARLPQSMYVYYMKSGCTCGMIPVKEAGIILVSGQDDCPIHGFGE